MADNFSSSQPRVLTVQDRSLDNVVFLQDRPPLTSEWNLINQIGNEKLKQDNRGSYPSGWLKIGGILQDVAEADAVSGTVTTSTSYAANTLKLISRGDNIAMVNGWPVLVQGSNSSSDNNVITLEEPGGQLYDFVFLEVWRKLVSYNESLYPYGNVTKTPYSDNEIYYTAVGAETTKRVQVQYRIRVESINTVLNAESDIFSDVDIYPIGGRTTGEYTFDTFRRYGSDDAGLYIAGDGSSTSQTDLSTVDGYVYAIPMFLVVRRTHTTSIFNAQQLRNSYVSIQDQTDGFRVDRPDAKLADAIYADDILDYRHKILTSGKELESVLKKTVDKLLAGTLTTALKRGYDADGQASSAAIGGSSLMKVERVNSTGSDNIPNVGTGDSFRRAYCNAELTTDHNVIAVPINGIGFWAAGTVAISSFFSKSYGSIVSVDGIYSAGTNPLGALITGVTLSTTSITIASSSNLVGTTATVYLEFTFKYTASDDGLKDVPKEFLEIDKGTYLPIATRDNDVLLRFNSAQEVMSFGANPGVHNPGDTDARDYLHYAGGNYSEETNFGHEMVVYRTTNGSNIVTLSLTNSKLNGYYIHGVKAVQPVAGSNPVNFTVARTVTGSTTTITDYIITVPGYASTDMKITLYTGSINIGTTYSVAESLKFFELSKQGKGIIDTYEMLDVPAEEGSPSGTYTIDTGDKPIIAFAYKARTDAGYVVGQPYAFVESTGVEVQIGNTTINRDLPVLGGSDYSTTLLPTRVTFNAPGGNGTLRVSVLVHSYVTSAETPYNVFYKFNPYQGILSSTSAYYGRLVSEGPAVITTLGSGAITNFTYSTGTAIFVASSRTVVGTGTLWSQYIKSGDYMKVSGEAVSYRVLSVTDDTHIILAEKYAGTATLSQSYEISRIDIPKDGISNVVDRMPSYFVSDSTDTYITDYRCKSVDMSLDGYDTALLLTGPVIKRQDPMVSSVNDFKVGSGSKTNIRGRYDFVLSDAGNEAYKLSPDDSPRADIRYVGLPSTGVSDGNKKVYQTYLFSRSGKSLLSNDPDLMGRLYLLVVSGEYVDANDNMLTTFSDTDTVDLYELDGRPLVKGD